MSINPAEPWRTVKELAQALRKTERWVIDQCQGKDSAFPHHKVGRDILFSPEDQRLIDEMTARGRLADEREPEPGPQDALLERALQGIEARRRTTSTAAAAAR